MKKNTLRALAFSLILCILTGFVLSPVKTYAAFDASELGPGYTGYSITSDMFTQKLYNNSTYGELSVGQNISVPTSYLNFRFWLTLPKTFKKGSDLVVVIKLNSGPGDIGSTKGWFGSIQNNGFGTSALHSNVADGSYRGDQEYLYSLTLSEDSNTFAFDLYYSSRSTTSFSLKTASVTFYYKVDDVLLDSSKETTSNTLGIFHRLGELLNNFSTLPTNIGNALKGFFDSLGAKIQNLPNSISGFFSNLGDRIGGFFSPLTDKISSIFNSLFVMDDLDPEFQDTLNDIQSSSDSFNDLSSDLKFDKPDIDEFIPAAPSSTYAAKENIASLLVSIPFGSDISIEFVTMAFSFALIGLILYGKR